MTNFAKGKRAEGCSERVEYGHESMPRKRDILIFYLFP